MVSGEHYDLAEKILSRFDVPDVIRGKLQMQIARGIELRDKQWNRALGATQSQPMTPIETAKWLETDRRKQVNEVKAARQRRGPLHY